MAASRLEWVQRNRTRRERTASIGAATGRFVRDLWTQTVEPAQQAADALAEIVDEDFRRHCRVAEWARGQLAIQVDEPAMLVVIRLKWASRIKRELPGRLSRRLNRVVFSQGRAGVPVGDDLWLD
jgi:hypothetical protein